MSGSAERPSDAQLTQMYNARRQELRQAASQIGELESEASEHQLVLDTLNKAHSKDPSRTCFRLVGGILIERTVADVVPQLETNLAGLQQLILQQAESYKKKEQDFTAFVKKYNIVIQPMATESA